jgi:hypothetical protein
MLLKLVLLLIGASLLLLAIRRLNQYKLKERYTLAFLLIGTPFLVLAVWPNAIGYVAHLLNIDYRSMVLLCVTAFFLLMVLELLTIVSQQDRKITALAQMVGILMTQHDDLTRPGMAKLKAVEEGEIG